MADQMNPGNALVTGAGQRIGRAIALDLAAQGYGVAVHYNSSAEAAAEVVDQIKKAGGRAVSLKADLGQEVEVQPLLPAAAAALGPITLLVNNASRFEDDLATTATRQSWDDHLEANLRAPFVLIQALAAGLPEGMAGNVINLLDQRVWRLTPRFVSYTVSKMGLWALTRTMAQALAPQIRVNGIGPGPALRNTRQTEAHFEKQKSSTILGRGTSPEEICAAVRFILASPAMTGQMIALDGGQHLAWATPDVAGIVE